MDRISFPARIMLILMVALFTVIVATFGIGQWEHRKQAPRYMRIRHAAGIIALLHDAEPRQIPKLLRAINGDRIRARVMLVRPQPAADDIRAVHIEDYIRRVAGTPLEGFEAYTTRAMKFDKPNETGIEGRFAMAIVPLSAGRFLVVHDIERPAGPLVLLGVPANAWAGILGFAVAALALLTALREVRPLRRLTESITTFDGSPPAPHVAETGAPDIRRLVRAVHDMQSRVATLLQERSFLIGAISHDLKTYLTRLRLRAEGIEEPGRRERVVGDLDAMTDLIETSLAFARGTASGGMRSRIDLGDLVAIEIEERKATGPTLALTGTYANGAVVSGDPVALRRVVCNILDNALKYARSGVDVRVERTATQCRVVVEDDGPGIAEAERALVFAPFYRTDPSRSRRTGGTGLGLAISRQIVEAHNGAIEVASGEAGGARLAIALPHFSG